MTKETYILLLEDSETDSEIVQRLLKKQKPYYKFKLAMDKETFLEDLDIFKPDVILADNSLPGFNAIEAIGIVNQRDLRIPFIMVTGAVSEEFAAEIIKKGADDYILKDRMARLPKAIEDALKQRNLEKEKEETSRLLYQSEDNLKAIFNSASEGFVLIDINGKIKDFNYKYREIVLQITGLEVQKGKNIEEYIEIARRDQVASALADVLKGQTIQFDRLYYFKSQCWINFIFSPVKKTDEITGICITVRDITGKKLDEQQKEFDKNNLHALINNTKDLMWSVDRDFRLITSNNAFDDLVWLFSGAKPSKETDILKDLYNVDRIFRFKKLYERAFSGETFSEIEYTDIPFEMWSEISFYPIYEKSQVVGTACFSRDITERKKDENKIRLFTKRLSAILNTLPANIALLDEDGYIVEVNDSWKKFADDNGYVGTNYGINDNYLLVSSAAASLNEPDGELVAAGIEKVIKGRLTEFVFEYPCDTPDIKRWFRLVVTPLQDKDYIGAVVMHIDISEIRQLEQQRLLDITESQKKITRAMLQGQEKERTRLGQELHDNISQLLAATKMKLGFCLKYPDRNQTAIVECAVYVQEAMTEARNLSHKMVLPRFEENSFKQSIEFLSSKYQDQTKDIELETDKLDESRIPDEIKETFYRILQEQLNNIEKYAKATKIFIQMVSYEFSVGFMIKDNGIGFNTEKKSKGIGLTNIMNRAESYNGSAKIISQPGAGCMLVVEIPLP
jgi:PAS domain S-box-containing protein